MITANVRTSFIACLPPPAWCFGLISSKGLSLLFSFSWPETASDLGHESPRFRLETCICWNGMDCWIGVRDACHVSRTRCAGRPLSPSTLVVMQRLLNDLPRVQAVLQATVTKSNEPYFGLLKRNCVSVRQWWKRNPREILALRWDVSVSHTLTYLFFILNLGFIVLSFQMKWAFTCLDILHTD